MMRRLKKLCAALVVAVAAGAVLTSSALAAAVTQDVQWYVGASPGTLLTGSETINMSLVGSTGTFSTEVGSTTYTIEYTGLSCVGCTIENVGGEADISGHWKFTGITVEQPAGCSVASELTTTALSATAGWMAASGTEPNYIKFVPTKGETTAFATIEITGCALATTLVPKGSIFFQGQNATGTQAVKQEVHSSEAINNAAGGSLKVGSKAATFSENVEITMTGAHAGQALGRH